MKRHFSPFSALITLALVMVALLALSACGGDPTSTPVASSGTKVPVTDTTAVPAGQTTTTFKLDTTGTIAGIHQVLSIGSKDAVKFSDGKNPAKKGTVAAKQYDDLVTQVGKADFFNLKDKYDSGNVADDRYYAIAVQNGSQSKTVTVAEEGGKGITPQALLDLVTMLNAIQKGLQ